MARLRAEMLERVESFADRGLKLAQTLERKRVYPRVIDQTVGAFTSVGANVFEAHEALTTKDFCKCLGIAIKEASESRFWLRRAYRNGWIPASRLTPLEQECVEITKILATMAVRTRGKSRKPVP